MKRPPRPKTPQTKKRSQRSLFDASGSVHADAALVPLLDGGAQHIYSLDRMRFFVCPSDGYADREIIGIALDGLKALRKTPQAFDRLGCQNMPPIDCEVWEMHCDVVFRRPTPDFSIRVTVTGNRMQMSLPNPWNWSRSGLDWLYDWAGCCQQNNDNPTPWYGRACNCRSMFDRIRNGQLMRGNTP